jgi:hypothetical protein
MPGDYSLSDVLEGPTDESAFLLIEESGKRTLRYAIACSVPTRGAEAD